MKIDKLLTFFGKEFKGKELNEFFRKDNFNVIKEIKNYMKTDLYEGAESVVYASNEENGYSLVFEDELDYLNIEDGNYGESGNYYLSCIHFYSQGKDGFNVYKDKLINGIKMINRREEIRTLMKKPYKSHNFLDEDIWGNINGFRVFVNYNKGQNTPDMISIMKENSSLPQL